MNIFQILALASATVTAMIPSIHFALSRKNPSAAYQTTLPHLALVQATMGVCFIVSLLAADTIPLASSSWLVWTFLESSWFACFARRAALLSSAVSVKARRLRFPTLAIPFAYIPTFAVSMIATVNTLQDATPSYMVSLTIAIMFQLSFVVICIVPVAPALPSNAGIKKIHILAPVCAAGIAVLAVLVFSLVLDPAMVSVAAAAIIVPQFQLAATLNCVRPSRPIHMEVCQTLYQTLGSPRAEDFFLIYVANIDPGLVDEWRARKRAIKSIDEIFFHDGTVQQETKKAADAMKKLERYFSDYLLDIETQTVYYSQESASLLAAGFMSSSGTSSVSK